MTHTLIHAPRLSQWSTDEVAQRHRIDFYAQALSSALAPLQMSSAAPDFRADLTMADLGLISVGRRVGSAHRCFREQRDLARATARTFHLVLNKSSSWGASHRGPVGLEAGDGLLFDSALPADLNFGFDFDVVHLKMSEDWVRRWVPSMASLVGTRLNGNPWGRVLTAFAHELTPEFALQPPLPQSTIADHIGTLLALAASSVAGGLAVPQPRPSERELSARIADCVVQRCAEPGLLAESVAASVGISARTLHRCLTSRGKSFGSLLLTARSDAALRMLQSPIFRRLTVAEIGRRAGFSDASHLTRVVRSRAGMTPAQLRKLHRTDDGHTGEEAAAASPGQMPALNDSQQFPASADPSGSLSWPHPSVQGASHADTRPRAEQHAHYRDA